MTIKAALQRTIAAAILAILLSSCIGNTVQHRYRHISKDGWSRNDTIAFELPPANMEGRYAVDTEIRTAHQFPYQRVYLIRELSLQSPIKIHKDTVCIEMGSSEAYSKGKGVTMKAYSHSDTTLVLKEGQEGNIKLYHIMSREVLPHITDVGIRVRAIR